MKIERVREEDAVKLLEVYAYYVKKTAISFEYEVPSVEEFAKRIREISAQYPYIKAVDKEGKILGYAYATAFKNRPAYDWAVETTIYVEKNQRQSGIGRTLYDTLEKSLADMGVQNLNACIAYTSKPDEYLTNASLHFHQKLGYEIVGTFHKCGYKFHKWYDMIWMEKMIGAHDDNPSDVKLGEWTIRCNSCKGRRKIVTEYKFWGWENADTEAITDEYKGIHCPRDLYDALSEIWCADTCAPRMRSGWNKENKTLGQCSITAFLAQDIFGGKVYGIPRDGGNYHCYNVIGDCRFDLTSEQFGDEKLDYENNPEQFREVHFAKEEKRLRYEYLKAELKEYCKK